MGRKGREHRERVAAGLEKPFRQAVPVSLFLKCGKCKAIVSEAGVTAHLKECQPAGAKCGKCGQVFPPEQFLAHFKACEGKVEIAPP